MFLEKINNLFTSLTFRLAVLYALVIALVASGGYMAAYYRIYSIAMQQMDTELVSKVEEFNALEANPEMNARIMEIFSEVETEDPGEEFYRLLYNDGRIIMSTNMLAWGAVDHQNAIQQLRNSGRKYVLNTVTRPDRDSNFQVITAAVDENRVIQIGETLGEVEDYLAIFKKLFRSLTIIITLLALFLGWFLARWALADMASVTETAENIANGDYAKRVSVKGNLLEIKRLARTFNKMLDRIQGLMTSMQDVNDSIAHDLRSPLTRIRGIAEMTLTKGKSLSDYEEMASSTIEECDELIELINTMLDIAETQAGVAHFQNEPFDVVEVLAEACELFRPLAEERQIDLQNTLPESHLLNGDKKRMQRIVTNLLENAIKYTNAGGAVRLAASATDKGFDIIIEDSGIGISEDDLPHIYDRFFRSDKSRRQGGFGLGLSLAKAYAEAMNGRLAAQSIVNKGSVFTLSFAKATPS